MITMPGNPHHKMADAQKADYVIPPDDDVAHPQVSALAEVAERLAALAFEQRTQALIAYAQVADDETADRLWVDHITPRLGLGGDRG